MIGLEWSNLSTIVMRLVYFERAAIEKFLA